MNEHPPAIIPFNRPSLVGKEMDYLAQAVANGHISGDGGFTKRCHRLLEETLGVKKALLTTSCTHALEMAAMLLDIQPGDEVIVPSFTFVSTINAFVLRGAVPVFADIRSDTLNLDEDKIISLITKKTKAIIAMHYGGISCEMNKISTLAGLPLIEDNAHGLFGKYKGKFLGTLSQFATLSFHETKNFSCGEGGALLLNREEDIERAEIIREKGTNRSRFFRGHVDKYSWVDIGSSFLPSDLLAAFLLAQLEERERIQAKRKEIWQTYYQQLTDWAEMNKVGLPTIPAHCEQAYHLFYLLMPSLDARQKLIKHLNRLGIMSVFHYQPLHLSPMGRKFGGKVGDCPITEQISDRLLRLPFYFSLSETEQQIIINSVRGYNC
ncbi:MAG: dTDP-4-amino-4,6-dideoxygalactose transaminase [Acidobacteriota bacterium]|nr:dTDP-4-amino-4,6-dideoxygalactose transaminase [Acidobacteriota bacterium]